MSINIYLITEDIKIEKKKCIIYEFLKEIPYIIDNEEIVKESERLNLISFYYLIDSLDCLNLFKEEVFCKGIFNNLYKSDLTYIKQFFKKDISDSYNEEIKKWLYKFKELIEEVENEKDIYVYYDFKSQVFRKIKLTKSEKEAYVPSIYLPLIDDRIFSYGIDNIQSMYFNEMIIGSVTSEIYDSLFVENKNKNEIFSKNEYDKTITLNQFIDYLTKFTELKKPHKNDSEFFEVRKENFKRQLELLKEHQDTNGNKKIFSFIIV